MRESNVVHLAADRAICGGLVNAGAVKLVRFPSGLLAGFAGSLATQNVVSTMSELASCDLADDASIGRLFTVFQGLGAYQLAGAAPKAFWAEMLLAMKGTLVYMGNVAGWHRVAEPVKTIGDGGHLALGSWTERIDLQPEIRLRRAIEVAATFMPSVVSRDCDYGCTAP